MMNTQERKIPKPHPHAALIKAWADGATIQSETTGGRWVDVPHPSWFPDLKYRIKTEDKERVKAALKGESAICVSELERSKTELDGMPLDVREKALVRELRRGVSGEDLFVLFKQLSYGERM